MREQQMAERPERRRRRRRRREEANAADYMGNLNMTPQKHMVTADNHQVFQRPYADGYQRRLEQSKHELMEQFKRHEAMKGQELTTTESNVIFTKLSTTHLFIMRSY